MNARAYLLDYQFSVLIFVYRLGPDKVHLVQTLNRRYYRDIIPKWSSVMPLLSSRWTAFHPNQLIPTPEFELLLLMVPEEHAYLDLDLDELNLSYRMNRPLTLDRLTAEWSETEGVSIVLDDNDQIQTKDGTDLSALVQCVQMPFHGLPRMTFSLAQGERFTGVCGLIRRDRYAGNKLYGISFRI